MNRTPQVQAPVVSDEIDLFDLFHSIWRQKKLVIGCTLFAGLIGVGYALLAPREYQVSSVLRPAAINELDALNRSEVYKLPPADALAKVGAQLDSYDARLGFFKANPALFQAFQEPGRSLEQSFEAFNRNSIKLILPDPKKSDSLSSYIRLELQYPTDVDGVAILNGFVDYAIAQEREQVGADLKVIVNNRLTELKGKIDAARSNYETDKESKIAKLLEGDKLKRAQLEDELSALRLQMKMQRSNRLAELNEAISIAKSMGIKSPTTPSSMADAGRSGSSQVMRTEVNNQQIPLYFLGTDALEAERRALQQRTSDDFTSSRVAEIGKELQLLEVNRQVEVLKRRGNEDIFLQDVEPLRAEVARLRGLNIDMSALKLVTIDRRAQEPLSPIKPKKVLVVALSLAVGLLLGMFVALVRHLVLTRRQTVAYSGLDDDRFTRRERKDEPPLG
ncbi:LPS O-antigen chain length determinant protein WzzB [Pseudomonas shahriarae]|uniref:LPS O-antigen chain length determinant protein WzzB n=1 Tax=Pseudomonas TaxID=286 RepID=UPI001475B248|nr:MULTISPECIES: Wzz/FepE/Etk N-terminal domain-containing protein [Pseudomonas]MDZ4304390.1 Wzz/FepE/Etk N-terminal domain-containing protein [Pseudomonas sp.]MBJ2239560.1 LPS O-antigen chain length determinant protein WzzB [Pseudomonas sp. MF6768]MBJ2251483.1 LPS O-antigen chain length determinant protein WzzB [Pseudomonas sp. MF6784]MBK3456348.1 LPS O-antigen chain length determinant protein WzzB [Pseudomonas sp. MF6754]MBU4627953.1 LPS O-antigen chain length determinant protein WzzB [Pseud